MTYTLRFDTWEAFLDAAKRPVPKDDAADYSRASHARGSRKALWRGTKTWTEALDIATDGYARAVPQVERLADAIKDHLAPQLVDTFTSRFDVAGGSVDIDRYLHGEPECLVELIPVKVAKPGRVITILVNAGALANVLAEDIIQRGAAIVALIELLELLQHNTEVWVESTCAGSSSTTSTPAHSTLVRVKGTDERLDLGRLLFAVAHPSFLRRLVFALRQQAPDEVRRDIGIGHTGIGFTCNTIRDEEVGSDLTLQQLQSRYDPTVRDSELWIREQLTEFGLLAEQH